MDIIISAIIGLFTGVIGTFFAPWANWKIEKRKIKHQKRIEMINIVREFVQQIDYDRSNFRETAIYSQIKPFLDKDIINKIEISSRKITIDVGDLRGSGVQNYKNEILDNLTRLEKKWGLI
jgi:hypothetical protein